VPLPILRIEPQSLLLCSSTDEYVNPIGWVGFPPAPGGRLETGESFMPVKRRERSLSGRGARPPQCLPRLSGRQVVPVFLALLLPALVSCGDGGTGPGTIGIGEEGGTATLAGGSVTLSVPRGALSTFVEFSAVLYSPDLTSDLVVPGSTYEIGPSETTFAQLVTLTLGYDPAGLPIGVREGELRLYRAVGSRWEPTLRTAVDPQEHTVSGFVDRLGRFGVHAFPVMSVDVSPTFYTLEPGEDKRLMAAGRGPSGELLPDRAVTWTSGSDAVATVDSVGRVTAVGMGNATITASVGSQSSSVTIRVIDCSAQSHIPASECEALITAYGAITQENWRDSQNWVSGLDPCDWYGVTCADGFVSAFHLAGQQYPGSIPSAIGDLTNLTRLDLSVNRLSGPIPSSIGNLTVLESLDLHSNDLSGSIPPEIGQLGALAELYLYWNDLTGSIPPEIGGLSTLTHLRIDGNQLSGSIPRELGGLSSLVVGNLTDNRLSGSIPSEVGTLTNLESLALSVNELSGPIPPELGQLSNLLTLGLRENQLSGGIPAALGNLVNLTNLSLEGNELAGPVPLPVAQLGGMIQAGSVLSRCRFVPPGNTGLFMPDNLDYRNADLDGDGMICFVTIGGSE